VVLGSGETGPVARRLFNELTGIQYARRDDSYGWTRRVRCDRERTNFVSG
jgi:branched-chain amino acid aminotransferase